MTTALLILLTIAACIAVAASAARLRIAGRAPKPENETNAAATPSPTFGLNLDRVARLQAPLTLVTAIGAAVLLAFRWLGHTDEQAGWLPLASHLDGLLLLTVLIAAAILYLQLYARMTAVAFFAQPLLALLLAWAICAANWTYQPFDLTVAQLWRGVHITSVYLGTAGSLLAAVFGVAYLYAQKRLRDRGPSTNPGGAGFASLESLEAIMIRLATFGFALLSIALVTGAIILLGDPAASDGTGPLGTAWYRSPKVWLATIAWLAYAVVMNVRHATAFRGSRAAWISIAGFVCLILVYGLVTATPAAEVTP